MTCTNPAVSGSPLVSTSKLLLSLKMASPSSSLENSDHQLSCSGRALLNLADPSESNLTRTNKSPPSVTPPVEPSHPLAVGPRSCIQRWTAARTAFGSATLPLMVCANMFKGLLFRPNLRQCLGALGVLTCWYARN